MCVSVCVRACVCVRVCACVCVCSDVLYLNSFLHQGASWSLLTGQLAGHFKELMKTLFLKAWGGREVVNTVREGEGKGMRGEGRG